MGKCEKKKKERYEVAERKNKEESDEEGNSKDQMGFTLT